VIPEAPIESHLSQANVALRTGREGRISCLKHRFSWDRTLMGGIQGARIWCGYGVLAHSLIKLGGLEDERNKAA
jgi:transposase, IS5 family